MLGEIIKFIVGILWAIVRTIILEVIAIWLQWAIMAAIVFPIGATGTGETARINPTTGALSNPYFYSLSTGWTDLVTGVPSGSNYISTPMVFYVRGDGHAVTGDVSNNGYFQSRYGANLGPHWSITPLNTFGLQFFYDSTTGQSQVWRLNDDETYTYMTQQVAFEPGWDIVVGIR